MLEIPGINLYAVVLFVCVCKNDVPIVYRTQY